MVAFLHMGTDAQGQALKWHLDMLLLATLEGGPRHGYAVKEALQQGGGARFDLPTGTIYPALHRLEAAGLIEGHWSSAGSRRRRTYTLTAAGRRRLRVDRSAWRDFASGVSALVEPGRWSTAS